MLDKKLDLSMASVLRRLLKKSKSKNAECKSYDGDTGDSVNKSSCCRGDDNFVDFQLNGDVNTLNQNKLCQCSLSHHSKVNRHPDEDHLGLGCQCRIVNNSTAVHDSEELRRVETGMSGANTSQKLKKCEDSVKNTKSNWDDTRSEKSQSSASSITDVPKQNQVAPSVKPEVRTKRLMKEYREVTTRVDRNLFSVDLVEDSLYDWNVKLFRIDPDSELYKDMADTGIPYILLNITFPDNFPFLPPFMRVVFPRIEGGFVLDGGAICMELLTPRGWSSAYSVEAIIMQFAASVVKGRGRMNKKSQEHFSRKEAESTFKKLVKTHERFGWVTPPQSEG